MSSMRKRELSADGVAWIVSDVLERAREAVGEGNKTDFQRGKILAYYEVLDMVKSRLMIRGEDIKDYGYTINIDNLETELEGQLTFK